jgi:hypothetical protein
VKALSRLRRIRAGQADRARIADIEESTHVRRICTIAAAGAGALALPAGAQAATAAFDLPCYVAGQPGSVALSGYAPNVAVTVGNADLGTTQVTTDATGSATVPFRPPSGNDLSRPGSKAFAVTATEAANPASTASATSRIAPLAFSTDEGTKSPKAKRSWYFSGFAVGKPIYAHFRFGGRTRGTYRFGVATGPCGEYKRRAPGIAIPGRVSRGTWTIQVDQVRTYSATTSPRLRDSVPVIVTYRPRNATLGAASLQTRWGLLPSASWS